MDFHAYAEVYLGDTWHTFDARYNRERIGRVKIAHGLDAVDGAFSTIYGVATLASFDVWAYQVDRAQTLGNGQRRTRQQAQRAGGSPRRLAPECAGDRIAGRVDGGDRLGGIPAGVQ